MSDPLHEPRLPLPATRGAAVAASLAALDRLAELGETVEDEWTYVSSLVEAGRSRIRAAAGGDPTTLLAPDREVAIATLCSEAALIADPHRAIDWLSTFPAAAELAFSASDRSADATAGRA